MVRLGTFCSGNRVDTLIEKLRTYENKMASDDASKLAIAIARRSDLIPESRSDDNIFTYIGVGALSQAAYLLRNLINRIEDPSTREGVAKDVAKNIEGLPFAYEFRDRIRKFRKEEGSKEFVRVVSDECEKEIAHIFIEKLSQAVESQPIEDSHPQLTRTFYNAWKWDDQESLRQYARRRLEKRPEDVGKFLSALTGIGKDDQDGVNWVCPTCLTASGG
jgi:hypothetical protein